MSTRSSSGYVIDGASQPKYVICAAATVGKPTLPHTPQLAGSISRAFPALAASSWQLLKCSAMYVALGANVQVPPCCCKHCVGSDWASLLKEGGTAGRRRADAKVWPGTLELLWVVWYGGGDRDTKAGWQGGSTGRAVLPLFGV